MRACWLPVAVVLGMLGVPGCDEPVSQRPATSAPAVSASVPATRVGARWQLGGQPRRVVTRGRHAFLADVDGLSIYEVGDAGTLRQLSHVATAGNAQDLAWADDLLCVADGSEGLACFDVHEPTAPRLVDRLSLPHGALHVAGSAHGLAVLGEGGHLALLRPGVRSAELLALPGELRALAWVGAHIYVAAEGYGLLRVDVSGGPLRMGWHDPRLRGALSLAAQGRRLWVGTIDKQVLLLDVDAGLPRLVASTNIDPLPMRLDGLGRELLVSSPGTASLLVPASPARSVILGLSATEAAEALEVRAVLPLDTLAAAPIGPHHAVVARGASGLALLDLDTASVQASVAGARIDRLRVGASELAAWSDLELVVWQLQAAASAPVLRGRMRPGPVDVTACAGGWCALDAQHRLCRLALVGEVWQSHDCTEPAAGSTALAGDAQRLWMLGSDGGLESWNVAPWRRSSHLASPSWTGRPRLGRLVVDGHLAVALDTLQGILHVYDASTGQPRHQGVFLLQAIPADVVLAHGVAFVAEPGAGLQLVDLADPAHPRERAWLPLEPGPEGVAVRATGVGAELALAQGEAGVSLWAWDGQASMQPLWRVDTPGLASGVGIAGDAVWAVDGTGLVRIDAEEP